MEKLNCSVPDCDNAVKARDLCKMHYQRWLRHGHTNPTRLSGKPEDFYTPSTPGDCWIWRGSFNAYGYGRYGHSPTRMAHRMVYEKYRGRIADGLVLDHLCRDTRCVNPSHLEPVTTKTNTDRGMSSYALRYLCRKGLHNVSSADAWYVNTYGKRTCLECKRENDRRAEAKRAPRRRSGRRT